MGSNKTPFPTLLLVIFTILQSGCAGSSGGPGGSRGDRQSLGRGSVRSRTGDITVGSGGLADLDLGEDWDRSTQRPIPNPSRSAPSGAGGNADMAEGNWAIVLFTYSNQNHASLAQEAARRVRALGPDFLSVRTHPAKKGSIVIFGSYLDNEDPAVKTDLARLRSLANNGRRVFPKVMLTYVEPEQNLQSMSPFNLLMARRSYPNAQQLFTLDVAVWSTFDNPDLNYASLKKEAEAYCRELRAAGYEAYFHHNNAAKISNVTVGIFGSNAVNPRSGIYSPEVMQLLRSFPARLNNEQILLLPVDRFHPNRGTRPQAPALVEVPE